MRKWMIIVVGLAWAWSLLGAEMGHAGWSAGVAKVDITPEDSVWLAGYAARKAPSEGVEQPIHAKALALRDEDGTTLVLVTIDLIGVRAPLTDRVIRRVQAEHALPREAVVLLTSHTHCGPIPADTFDRLDSYGIDPDEAKGNFQFTNQLEDWLGRVIALALEDLKPAKATFGVGQADFAMNRREATDNGFKIGVNPDGPVDHRVPVLRVENEEGQPLAVVFGYACHNTTLGSDMLHVCGDYAGFAQEALEMIHPDAVALFVTGCGADANPHPRGTLEHARQHGQTLADAVEAVLNDEMTPLTGPLGAAYAEPSLRFDGPSDPDAYKARLDDSNSRRADHARRLLERFDAGEVIQTEYPYPIQVLALGDQLSMIALAGEVVVDYAIRLYEELGDGDHSIWVAAYANDVFGYVPSLRVLQEGGYEGGEAFYYSSFPTPFADDVEETILETVHHLMETVRAGD